MIGYLKGEILWADAANILLNVNGTGYEVSFFNNFTRSDFGTSISLFISHKRSEYAENLYGFKTIEEKLIFEALESINGVGARAVFAIMSILSVQSYANLQNIKLDDLIKIPGVGKSTAQKFLLGLANKLKKEFDLASVSDQESKSIEDKFKAEINTLKEWGVDKKTISELIKNNIVEVQAMSPDKFIKFVLAYIKKTN